MDGVLGKPRVELGTVMLGHGGDAVRFGAHVAQPVPNRDRRHPVRPGKRRRRKPKADVPSAFQDLISGLDMSDLTDEDSGDDKSE